MDGGFRVKFRVQECVGIMLWGAGSGNVLKCIPRKSFSVQLLGLQALGAYWYMCMCIYIYIYVTI